MSERRFLDFLAPAAILFAYAAAPTAVASAFPLPATTKLPEYSVSPGALHYRVAFAGQQALICLQLAGHENPVRTELPAGGKKHDIPRDKVRNRKHLLLAVPQ